jgi:hypothetical protein
MAAADENVHALEALIDAPLLARVAFSAKPKPMDVAGQLDTLRLM